MRRLTIGLVLGIVLTLLVLGIVRQRIIAEVEDDISFKFDRYVFSNTTFPRGDFEEGRLIRRLLFPAHVAITYFDDHGNEVKSADRPGRYGAVVRINLCGEIGYRFVTLYKTPVPVAFTEVPCPISNQMPEDWGIDPQVFKNQQPTIGDQLKTDDGSPAFAILLAWLTGASPSDPPAVNRTNASACDEAWWYTLRKKLGLEPRYPYLTDLPRNYDSDATKRWPLILYLSSGAEYGHDMHVVRRSGLAHVIDDGKQIPAIVISPQTTFREGWNTAALPQLLNDVAAKYRVDPDRIYLTGGSGVWKLALATPERFASILPIDGATDPADAARLKDLPLWAFHSVGDVPTPLKNTTDMIDAVRKAGGHPHFTTSTRPGDVWDQVYPLDAPYTWLLAQKKGQPDSSAAPAMDASDWRATW